MPSLQYPSCANRRRLAGSRPGILSAGLLAAVCMGLMCQGDRGSDRPLIDEQLSSRIDAASDALTASGGHDYGLITELLEEFYGDEETTAQICSQFIDPPHCFRIAAVNIQIDNLDPQWQQLFCELEKQAWEAYPWGSEQTREQIEDTATGHFDECMMGLPFLAY